MPSSRVKPEAALSRKRFILCIARSRRVSGFTGELQFCTSQVQTVFTPQSLRVRIRQLISDRLGDTREQGTQWQAVKQ